MFKLFNGVTNLVALFGASIYLYTAGAAESLSIAKTYPGSPAWPSRAQWALFNDTTNGNLIKAVQAASACYPGSNQALVQCLAAARVNQHEDPIQVITAWFAGFACPATYSTSGNCSLGNYPTYVVKALKKEDVAEAIKFANKHNLRLVVKNTGHDFLGRNIGYGSLSIWTHHLGGIQFVENWKPSIGPPLGKKQSAVVIGSGVQWKEVYGAAYQAGKIVVGGASPMVGAAGGWPLGGGHSPMSNRFGLGVDNILEMEVVLPSGEIVVTNSNSYPDLFWAMRGGGGSTFGIVTKMTYKTYPAEAQNGLRVVFTPGSSGPEGFLKGMAYLMSLTPQFVDAGMVGYPIMWNNKYDCLFTMSGKEWSKINEFITPVEDELKDMGLTVTSVPYDTSINTLLISSGLTPNSSPGLKTGTSIMGTRLLSRESFNNVTNWERVLGIFFDQGYIMEPFALMGGQVSRNADLDMALNPAWRKAIMHFSILDKDSDKYTRVEDIQKGYRRMQEEHVPLLDEMSVDSAAYLNEASYIEPQWQKSFWGSNYQKLVSVKRKYDANNTFWCHPCVNSEALVLGSDNKLYKP